MDEENKAQQGYRNLLDVPQLMWRVLDETLHVNTQLTQGSCSIHGTAVSWQQRDKLPIPPAVFHLVNHVWNSSRSLPPLKWLLQIHHPVREWVKQLWRREDARLYLFRWIQ
jgi:hypothetical protein